jgi:uncharacterized surface protein with fasciclin (FAS1) repeats
MSTPGDEQSIFKSWRLVENLVHGFNGESEINKGRFMKSFLKLSLTGLASLFVVTGAVDVQAKCQSIVEIAASTPGLSTLVTALNAADLVETLSGPGPFTVFAPVNQAFAKIPSADLQALLNDRLNLRSVLLAHVVVGQELTLANLKDRNFEQNAVLMANGSTKYPGLSETGSTFDGANYISNDIQACNGIIQVIDTVLKP